MRRAHARTGRAVGPTGDGSDGVAFRCSGGGLECHFEAERVGFTNSNALQMGQIRARPNLRSRLREQHRCIVGNNGGIYSTWWDGSWHDWFRIGPEAANVPNTNTVTALARQPDHIDLFVVGNNGGIYSTWWPSTEPAYRLDVNVILVGSDNFTAAHRVQTDDSIAIARSIFAKVGLDLSVVGRFRIPDAGGYETIDSASEAADLTSDWTVPNDALDLFVVRVMTDADGRSPVNGPCDKDEKGSTGSVVSLNGSTSNSGNTFAHEIGHYLGLNHVPDSGNFIGGNGASNSSTGIFDWQGNVMEGHCFIKWL